MGYTEGDILYPNDAQACKTFNGMNYCGSDLQPIHMMNVQCTGNEANLNDCNYDLSTESCAHDTVIR